MQNRSSFAKEKQSSQIIHLYDPNSPINTYGNILIIYLVKILKSF